MNAVEQGHIVNAFTFELGKVEIEAIRRRMLGHLDIIASELGARVAIVAPKVAGIHGSDKAPIAIDHALAGAPSCLFDAVAVVISEKAAPAIYGDPDAVTWVADAFKHCKVIGHSPAAAGLLDRAHVAADDGVVAIGSARAVAKWIERAAGPRMFAREPKK